MAGMTYRQAGLDLDQYGQTIKGIGPLARRTHDRTRVLDGFGSFASLFDLDPNRWLFSKRYRRPVLVTCTDGVGTKIKVAAAAKKYDTVGIDLVAMCVNDCICTGGEPLIFQNYIATPKDDTALTVTLVRGISDGCLEADCSLTGGETAVMPGVYADGEFDMAGFCVGVVERDHVVTGEHAQVGDKVIGLASAGFHSNGYSLIRKVVFGHAKLNIEDRVPDLNNATVGEVLMRPTRIYVKAIREIVKHYPVKRGVIRALAHVTGGGLIENVPRVLPAGRRVRLDRSAWPVPPEFAWLRGLGDIAQAEMDRVFNMGVGFVVVAPGYFAESICRQAAASGVPGYVIGEVIAGEPGVDFVG